MTKKPLTYFLIATLFFIGLVLYNYHIAQKNISATRQSLLEITLVSYPEKVTLNQSGQFIWSLDSSPDLATRHTTIYYGFESSPSALTRTDSPEAVGYPHHPVDYLGGNFRLPDTFDVSIIFDTPGKVYFRGYAKVGDNHLWTDEKTLTVLTKP